MASVYGSGMGDAANYFFLSYVCAPGHDGDPDVWVNKFFRDLSAEVGSLLGLPSSAPVGFIDRESRGRGDWPPQLAHALSTCQVFVPLYSREYFYDEHCGKEWSAFSRRSRNRTPQGARFTEAIIPVLWEPVPPANLSGAARSIQFEHSQFGALYSQIGFYGLIKLRQFEREYEQAVRKLAQRIVEVAQNVSIGPEPPESYGSLANAHELAGRPQPASRRVRITIVALAKSDLPVGRSVDYYGSAAQDWNPYGSGLPLAGLAAALAHRLGYRPEIGDLGQHRGILLDSTHDPSPGVLIVDAWATTQPKCQQTLRQIDALGTPWIQVVVPWNMQDAETREAAPMLRRSLEAALPGKLAAGHVDSRDAVAGVPGLAEFNEALRIVIQAAAKHYFKHGQAHPPTGQAIERPRLIGPVIDPSNPEH